MMKIHLGCGSRHFDGYLNIDFPPSKHTIQKKNMADLYADITYLSFQQNSIDEIRLHHVFEHFKRPVACALIVSWHSWLKKGGIIRIEVPDLKKMASFMASPLSSMKQKLVAERHIFGSQEADWGIHFEGYSPQLLKFLLATLGFKIIKINKNNWKGTYNFEIISRKESTTITKDDFEKKVKIYLTHFLVDDSESELALLDIWMNLYHKQIQKTYGK